MKRKKILFLFLIMSLVLLPISKAYAVGVGGDWGNVPSTPGGGGCDSGNCYSTGSAGVRITLVNSAGNRISGTKSADYWFNPSSANNFKNNGKSVCYNEKYAKAEIMGLSGSSVTSKLDNCSNASFRPISDLLSVNIGNTRKTEEADTVMRKILAEGKAAGGNRNSSHWDIYDRIFVAVGYKINGTQVTIKNLTKDQAESIYIQFEPLITFQNNGSAVTKTTFFGTISEIAAIGRVDGISGWALNAPIVSYMFSTTRWDGIISTSSKPSKFAPLRNGSYAGNLNNFFSTTGGKYRGYSVGYIALNDLDLGPQCDEMLQDALKTNNVNTLKNKIDAIKNELGSTECAGGSSGSCKFLYNNTAQEMLLLKEEYGSSKLTCNYVPTCQQKATAAYKFNSWQSGIGVSGSNYENYITKLYNKYKNLLILTENWKLFEKNGPQCQDLSNCPATPSTDFECTGNLTFADSTVNDAECFKQSIAYNVGNNYVSNKEGQTPQGCNIYCYQTATFDFPDNTYSNGQAVKAGTVFKWGKNTDLSDSLFGNMTITKKCVVVSVDGANCTMNSNYTIDTRWASNTVKTSLTLVYDEPNSDLDVDKELKRNLVGTPTVKVKYKGRNLANATNFKCTNASCSNLDYYIVTANYSFNYKDDLKWYANKDDGSLVPYDSSHKNEIATNPAYYYLIGYGLPTSFTTPNGVYTTKMGVIVSSVGDDDHFGTLIKNYTKADGTHININNEGSFKYSCSFKIENDLFGEECEYDDAGNLISGSPEYCDEEEDDTPDGDVKNIDVVYRVVKLINNEADIAKAFPGRLGNGRTKGTNWNLDNSTILSILNTDVYSYEPMYKITLNSANINRIRSYNKDAKRANIDAYSEFTQYNGGGAETDTPGFTGYKCVEKNGEKYCASRFVSKLISENWLKGRCTTGNGNTITRANNLVGNPKCK